MIITYKHIKDYKLIIISDYSAIFDKTRDLLKRLEKEHLPKMDGTRVLYALKEPTKEHIEKFKSISTEVPDFIEIVLFLDNELWNFLNLGNTKEDNKTDYEKFMDYALSLPLEYEYNIIQTLFYKFNGSKEDRLEFLERLVRDNVEKVTRDMILPYIRVNKDTYASEVLISLNNDIQKATKTLDRFILSLSNRQVAYYVLKKEITYLFKEKQRYLNTYKYSNNLKASQKEVLEEFTIYDLTYLYLLFSENKYPEPLIILKYFERRNINDNLF